MKTECRSNIRKVMKKQKNEYDWRQKEREKERDCVLERKVEKKENLNDSIFKSVSIKILICLNFDKKVVSLFDF